MKKTVQQLRFRQVVFLEQENNSTALSCVHQSLLVQCPIIWLIVPPVCLHCQAEAAVDKPPQVVTRDLPVKVHSQVPVRGEEALVQVVHLVVVLHQQLQASLATTGRTHGLAKITATHEYTTNFHLTGDTQ